MSKVINRLVSL